jgi:hypothetical protein
MKRLLVFGVSLAIFALVLSIAAEEPAVKKEAGKEAEKKVEQKFSYVGAEKCKPCHRSKAKGDQYGAWESKKHSKAYETLASEESIAVAKELGIEDPQKSDKCLKCHVTAYGVEKERLGPKFDMALGVQCESCHGPGSDYSKLSVMKDYEASVAAGLTVIDESTCKTCHNEESPTYQEFVYKEAYAKIAHENPQKKEAEEESKEG